MPMHQGLLDDCRAEPGVHFRAEWVSVAKSQQEFEGAAGQSGGPVESGTALPFLAEMSMHPTFRLWMVGEGRRESAVAFDGCLILFDSEVFSRRARSVV